MRGHATLQLCGAEPGEKGQSQQKRRKTILLLLLFLSFLSISLSLFFFVRDLDFFFNFPFFLSFILSSSFICVLQCFDISFFFF